MQKQQESRAVMQAKFPRKGVRKSKSRGVRDAVKQAAEGRQENFEAGGKGSIEESGNQAGKDPEESKQPIRM